MIAKYHTTTRALAMARNEAAPGGLYRFLDTSGDPVARTHIEFRDANGEILVGLRTRHLHNLVYAVRQRNYLDPNILTTQEFLDRYSQFLVLDVPSRRWVQTRIEGNPSYRYRVLGQVSYLYFMGPFNVILVEKASSEDN
jgi:hypothetical protein